MKKRTTVLLTAFLISAILVSCGAFNADPVIDSFTASATTINVGDSVTFTITGSTKEPLADSDLVDYTGTIDITSNSGSVIDTIDIEASEVESFTKTSVLTFATAGTFEMTATLTAGDKAVEKSVTITVNSAAKPWDSETVSTLIYDRWTDSNIDYTGDVDWFKYDTVSSSYYIHWQDSYDQATGSSYTGDVNVSVFNASGTLIKSDDSGYSTSDLSYGAGYGIRILDGIDFTIGDFIYIKVESFDYSPSTGTYSLFITN